MANKVPLEIKCKVLKYYLETKCSVQKLKLYVGAFYGYEVSKQAVMKWIKQKDDILKTQSCIGNVF